MQPSHNTSAPREKAISFWVHFWDFLVWALIYFPIVTGGIWVQRPGLFLEISQLAVPVLIVGVLGAILARGFKLPLERATSVRLTLWLWNYWDERLQESPRFTLAVSTLFVGGIWTWASLARHQAFGSGAADLGIFTNAIWNLTHGGGYFSSLKAQNLFADHQSPIFWLAAPIFWLFPKAETLLLLQAFGLAMGAIPFFWLGRQSLGVRRWTSAFPLLYWLYVPTRNANAFDFHPETWMLPLFLAALVGLQSPHRRNRIYGAVFFLLALACKESAGIVAAGIGLSWILGAGPKETHRFTRGVGGVALLMGLGVFWWNTRYVPEHFFGTPYAYHDQYRGLGNNLFEIALSPILKPALFFSRIMDFARAHFLFWTLAPLGFLPLLAIRAWPAFLPGYLILFLSEGDHRVSTIYHYSIEPSVGLFWAFTGGLLVFLKMRVSRNASIYWILFFSLLTFERSELFRIRFHQPTPHHRWLRSEFLPCVDPGVSVSASGALVPHLSSRPWVHHVPILDMKGRPEFTGKKVECLILDPDVNNWPIVGGEWERMLDQVHSMQYREAYACGKVQVLESPVSHTHCMKCQPRCP